MNRGTLEPEYIKNSGGESVIRFLAMSQKLHLPSNIAAGSFHANSPKASRVTISDFDENGLKCSSTYMMATCKKVLSSGDKFDFYCHIYTGGSFLFFTHDVEIE